MSSTPADAPSELGLIPDALAAAYPESVPGLEKYARSLATDGVIRGLIGPREVPRLWERHLANCAVIEQLIPQGASLIDIGSGAGLPGIVLSLVRPDITVTLIDPLLRRTTYLEEITPLLGIADRVTVLRGRAQEFHGKVSGDVVTARAVAALAELVTWSWPMVTPGGSLVAMKGEGAAGEVAEARPTLTALGIDNSQVRLERFEASTGTATAVVIQRLGTPR